jgi:hypothetical protein
MSTLQKINFTPVTDILPVQRRDFPLADPTLAQPLNAVCLVDGEWMTLNSAYQLIRASDILTLGAHQPAGAGFPPRSFPLFAERGRYDVQAMSLVKMPVLWRGDYKIATISFGGRNFTGLVGHGALSGGDTDPVVGYVTRLPSSNGGQLRFISGWRS